MEDCFFITLAKPVMREIRDLHRYKCAFHYSEELLKFSIHGITAHRGFFVTILPNDFIARNVKGTKFSITFFNVE